MAVPTTHPHASVRKPSMAKHACPDIGCSGNHIPGGLGAFALDLTLETSCTTVPGHVTQGLSDSKYSQRSGATGCN